MSTFGKPASSTFATCQDADATDGDGDFPKKASDGVSWMRQDFTGSDTETNWVTGSACVDGEIGSGNCAFELIVTEVFANTNDDAEGDREYIEIYNKGTNTVNIIGFGFSDGGGKDPIATWNDSSLGTIADAGVTYDATTLQAGEYGVILSTTYTDIATAEQFFNFPPGTKLFTSADDGDGDGGQLTFEGIESNKPLAIFNDEGFLEATYGTPSEPVAGLTYSNCLTNPNADDDGLDAIPIDLTNNLGVERIPSAITSGVATYASTDTTSDWQISSEYSTLFTRMARRTFN